MPRAARTSRWRWSFALAALLLMSCSAGEADDAKEAGGAERGTAGPSDDVAEGGPPSDEEPPSASEADERDWEELRDQELEALAQEFLNVSGADEVPDDVEFVEYISLDEYAPVMVSCLTEQGWEAHETPDGGVLHGDIPEDQVTAHHEAVYRCHVQYPVHPMFLAPLDDTQLRAVYDYHVGDLTACLEVEGFDVPEPPTWETYREEYRSQTGFWTPYLVVEGVELDDGEWYRLIETCPPSLPPEELYGTDATGGG